jgi:hypothetical protein
MTVTRLEGRGPSWRSLAQPGRATANTSRRIDRRPTQAKGPIRLAVADASSASRTIVWAVTVNQSGFLLIADRADFTAFADTDWDAACRRLILRSVQSWMLPRRDAAMPRRREPSVRRVCRWCASAPTVLRSGAHLTWFWCAKLPAAAPNQRRPCAGPRSRTGSAFVGMRPISFARD